ncbi:MAG: N-acetylmuramoyl-L-alanine amidase [Mongoliitalea sp.]
MRLIDNIFIHCTAGFGDLAAIRRWWRSLGWRVDGYHYFIYEDGTVVQLQPLSMVTNGVRNFNSSAIHIAYQGGVDRRNVNKAVDTRTEAQKASILTVIRQVLGELKHTQDISGIKILGHRDISPDKNLNGIVDPWERIKECPSFDAIPEYSWITLSAA